MKRQLFSCAACAVAVSSTAALSYEITTHGLITDHAYRISVLNSENANSIAPVLGFDRLDVDYPFSFYGGEESTPYRDEAALANPASTLPLVGTIYVRFPQPQERGVLDALVSRGLLSGASGQAVEQRVRSWLLRGAVREDDNDGIVPLLGWQTGDDRDADPFGPALRVTRHFYDPIYDRAYDYPDTCATYSCMRSILWAIGRTNPQMPGLDADDTSRRNHFTWQDARNNYWWSIVLKRDSQGNGYDFADAVLDGFERMNRWATTIKGVGHVVHLLQDTGQPQHVRNDAHAPPLIAAWPESQSDAAYEAFTDYRVLRSQSTALQPLVLGNPLRRMRDDTLPTENNLPRINLGESNYYPGGGGRVQFSTPVKFFTTRHIETGTDSISLLSRRGLADLSNRSFFTAGTLPGFRECQPPGASNCVPTTGVTYPLPPSNLTASGYTEVTVPSGLRVHGRVVHLAEYAYPITDQVAPNYDASINTLAAYGGQVPLVTKGIWYDIVPDDLRPQYLEATGYVITYNTMRYTADVLMPRMVGYSAGMIDYFFRGRIQVEAPVDGLFAVTDHGIAHSVNADGYPICTNTVPPEIGGEPPLCQAGGVYGFTKLRVKLRNDTPTIVESGTGVSVPQDMAATANAPGPTGPRLVAVARYHRNRCYQPQLSGEDVVDYAGTITSATCAQGKRTFLQEISVSQPAAVSATDLNGGQPVPVTFNFSTDPIPINATDLFIQIVYRGPLGDEPDGIAVGRYDIREPTYLTLWNNTDHAGCNGNWVTGSGSGCSFPNGVGRTIGTARLCIGSQLVYTRFSTGGNGSLFLGRYARLAALLDDQPKTTRGRLLVGTANDLVIVNKHLSGQVRQAAMEIETAQAPYLPDPLFKKRGVVGSFRPMPFYLVSGADPQPLDDVGPSDVGALAPPLTVPALAETGGVVSFPNTPPAPLAVCTSPTTAAFFEDEIEAEALRQEAGGSH